MIREKEVEEVKNVIDTERGPKSKRESVVISKDQSDHENLAVLNHKEVEFASCCDLDAEGIIYDHIADLAKDAAIEG